MALTWSELVALLTPNENGLLTVNGAAFDTEAVSQLFRPCFIDGNLVVANCISTPDEALQQVSVTGDLAPRTFLGVVAGVLTSGTFALLSDGTVTVRLVVRVDEELWTLSKSFPVVGQSVFDQMLWSQVEITLDSTAPLVLPSDFGLSFGYPPNLPEVADRMIKGLSLRAVIDFRGYLLSLLSMFAPPVAVAGPIELYLQNDLDEDGTPLPTRKTMPQILLMPESDIGLTREVGEYTFRFSLEIASLFQQFPTGFGGLVSVLPTPCIAVRTELIAGDYPPIPISLLVYNTSGGRMIFNVGQGVNQPIQKQDISQLLNGVGVGTLLEPGNGFPVYEFLIVEGVSVTLLSGVEALAINGMQVAASIGARKQWSVLGGLLTIDAIIFVIGVNRSGTKFNPYASISAKAFLQGNENVILSAAVALPDLTFFIQLDSRETIDLSALVHGLVGNAIPSPITGATFAISGDIVSGAYSFESEILQEWVLFGTLEKGLVLRKVGLHLSTLDAAVSGGVYGVLTLAGAELILSATYEPGGWTFTGGTTPGQHIDLVALFADLFALFDVTLPPGLPTAYLDQLQASYETATGVFRVAAAVSVDAATYNLADLPLIGEWLDPSNRITLEMITFTVQTGGPTPTYVDFGFRVGFGTNDYVEVVIPITGKRPTEPALTLATPTPPAVIYPAEGSGTWVPAQRFFGPLAVEKLGFILDERGIGVQFNASLNVTGVLLEALGLKMLVPVDEPFIPSFGLDGLAVTFQTSVLTIGGGLVRVANPDYMQFDGALVVQAKKFGISAFGSYATSEPPSMFVFALLNVPLGGPPFFFISGFSGGFGFNRDLLMPRLWEIPRFPLVAGASPSTNPFGFAPTLGDFLSVMDDYMPVSIGQYWVGAGIEVTSFNLLKSQILLTLAFGNRLQVGILGLSTLSIPPDVREPVSRAQLALEAVFVPDDGVLSITAQLTPGSYVFAPECFLTGGFAFYLWFAPSPFAGDFVITLGGYNPYFTRPAHYPAVPLLGMNWFLAGSPLIFKGGAYIALTPRAIMAGGFLLGTWTTPGIKVSFSLTADFLISWKPFHYEITAGVSFNVYASLNLKLARVTLSVTVGAELHVWGPPFSGEAYINLSVISFTIAFGAAEDTVPPPIDWSEFKRTFLPPPMSPVAPAMRVSAGATATDSIVKALFASGLQMDLRDKPDVPVDYTVDPQLLELYVQTLIPAKAVSLNSTPLAAHNGAFGIGPMSVGVEKLASELQIEIVRNGVAYGGVEAAAVIERAPKALWLHDAAPQQTLNAPALIDDVAQGVTIKPAPDAPSHSLPIVVETLLYSPEGSDAMTWGADLAPATNPYSADDPWTTLTGTIAAPAIVEVRSDVIANLIYAGSQVSPDIDVAPLTDPDTLNLLDPVVLAPLGYEGAAA
ncbi:MAG TPA: DUF6603 domain-containing protein [Thermoanaerobaculia bacterium]|nr:DUF6603 domain-containing protein [Thermoanaerobaculia bacterium]